MTDLQIAQAQALDRCKFTPGSETKRFVRDMCSSSVLDALRELTTKQADWLNTLAHQYRKQLGRCMAAQPCAKCVGEQQKAAARGPQQSERWICPSCNSVNHGTTPCRRCTAERPAGGDQ